MKKYLSENEIQFELKGEQYYPVFCLPGQQEIGRFGREYLAFLKAHHKGTYTTLLTTGKLNEHLAEIDHVATELYRTLVA